MLKPTLFILLALSSLLPWITPTQALSTGITFSLLLTNPFPTHSTLLSKKLLQLSVIGLGFGLTITQVYTAGRSGLLYTLIGITLTLLLGHLLGRFLKIRPGTAHLISFGTAICGGSAIAAMAPVIEADDDEIAVSLATVFTLNAVALLLFPHIGHFFALDQRQFGLWAALAIHDTSSVVGAGAVYGAGALAIATTVKLARAAWIAPVTLITGYLRRSKRGVTIPWFILGFLAAAALRTWLPQADAVWDGLYAAARRVLVLTLFLIGAGLSRQVLREVGVRSLLHGVILWLTVGSLTLVAILSGWIR